MIQLSPYVGATSTRTVELSGGSSFENQVIDHPLGFYAVTVKNGQHSMVFVYGETMTFSEVTGGYATGIVARLAFAKDLYSICTKGHSLPMKDSLWLQKYLLFLKTFPFSKQTIQTPSSSPW